MGLLRKEDLHESFWLEGISNPNLLINGDFQVWQRGNIINCKPGVQYAADRWALWCGNDGSMFENKLWQADWTCTGNDNLIQIIEMPLRNVGSDLVFSIFMNIPEGEHVKVRIGGSQTGSVSDDSGFIYDEAIFVGTGEFKHYNFAINGEKNNSQYCKVVLKTSITGKISLTNAKLEVGTNATKFISRLYGEELALCQRYYFKNNWISTLMAHLGNGVMTTISYKYPVRMRTTPTVNKLVDKPVNIVRTKDFSVNIIDPDDSIISTKQSGIINNEMIDFQFNCSLDFKDYQIEIIDNAYEFDAEIY